MEYTAEFWRDELKRYSDEFLKFTESGKKIVKRYRDERKESENIDARMNILWANVRTLKPAIYSKPPKVEVSRRFADRNDAARVASIILERVIDYEVRHFNDYNSALSNSVDDRLLVGRGVAWIRYEPVTEVIDDFQVTEDAELGDYNALAGEEAEPMERIKSEHTPVDYVYWEDFAHLPARTWEEVTWVGRRVFLGKEEGVERFGEIFNEVPLTHSPDKKDDDKTSANIQKKAVIWEIWCKTSKKVYWYAEHFDELLDEKDDPLNLESFFPCPKPVFATITTGSLVPVADFKQYQDQANEIDEITQRIQHLTKALKVMGIYAADEAGVERLLKEGKDTVMIPITNWHAFVEKGGIGGALQFMPLGEIVQALQQLYQSREACKQVIYEITGISDILRGASMASETATAQQIKSQFASIRLNDMKDDVARYARDLLRMKAEIICSKYQPEIILTSSGIAYTPDGQFAPQAIALLKNEPIRNFQIDIQTDTLVQLDEQSDKQSRMEFLTAASNAIQNASKIMQESPVLTPLLMDMVLFGVRGFKIGRDLEGEFERVTDMLKNQAQQPKPDPNAGKMQAEQMKLQADQQAKQAEMQLEMQVEGAKLQQEAQIKQLEVQTELQKSQAEIQLEMQKLQMQINAETERERMRQEYETARNRESIAAQLEIARLKSIIEPVNNMVADLNTIQQGI
jgi:hypothetical protein